MIHVNIKIRTQQSLTKKQNAMQLLYFISRLSNVNSERMSTQFVLTGILLYDDDDDKCVEG